MKTKITLLLLLFTSLSSSNGVANNVLNFDGTNDFVAVSPYPTANGSMSFTAWVKLNTTTGFSTFACWSYAGDNLLIRTANGSLQLIFNNAALGGGTIPAGSWQHIAFTKTGYTFNLYVNGVLKSSGPLGVSDQTFTGCMLGSLLGTMHYLNGEMDDIGIWNRVLTLSEIQSIQSASITGSESGLLAGYNFDNGTAGGNNAGLTTLDDVSPNSNLGTLTNFALTGATSNWTALVFATYYVKYDAAGANNGSSWANAYVSLQAALDAVPPSSQIFVARGTYKPSSAYDLTNTSRYYHFRLVNNVAVYGGFAGTEATIAQRTNFAAGGANETILSGDIGVAADQTDNCYHVFYHPAGYGLTSTALLNGCTIAYGYANFNTPTTDPNYRGGGMYNGDGNQPTIDQCSFLNNYAGYGGGLYNIASAPTVTNCVFNSNTSVTWGGGMYNTTGASPVITNCLIINNQSTATGGGIYCYDVDGANPCAPVITNTTIANNSANLCGGVRMWYSSATLNNCIIWGNTHTGGGVGSQIALGTGGSAAINNSCYSNGVNDVNGTPTVLNSVTTDPQFVGTGTYPFAILGTSPCADAGNSSYNASTYDIRGSAFARKLDKTNGAAGTIDMGAYEFKVGTDVLPVELSSFTASSARGSVVLKWETATEVNNYGFNVERKTAAAWEQVGFVQGRGTTNVQQSYSFVDNTASERAAYRLKQIDRDGKFTYSKEVEVISAAMPGTFALSQNYPNPFNPATVITYSIGTTATVVLKVYDMLGREVAVLVNEQKGAGKYTVEFNASRLSSGLYMYRLDAGNFSDVKRLTLMK